MIQGLRILLGFITVGMLTVPMLFAQSGEAGLHGLVEDDEGNPLPGASVIIPSTSKGVSTDIDGQYSLSGLTPGTYTLQVHFVGYKSITRQVTLKPNGRKKLHFTLSTDTQTLDEINITGKSEATVAKEQPYTISVVDARELQNNAADLNQALNDIPGVNIRENGGLGSGFDFSLNGFSGKQVKFFLDGIPMDNFGSSLTLNNIPINVAERVEVYKGVVPVSLGADALGGAVNVITKQGDANYLDASYTYGSFNTHRTSVNAAYTHPDNGLAIRANIFQNYSDNNYTVDDVLVPGEGSTISRESHKRFHDAYDSKSLITQVGVVNKKWAGQLLAGIILSRSDNEVQTGATMDAVYGKITQWSTTIMPNIRYQKSDLIVDGLSLSLYGAYNAGKTQNIDTASRQYYWDGSYVEDPDPTVGEENKTMYKFTNNLVLGRAHLQYDINDSHKLSFNYVTSRYNRKGIDPVWSEEAQETQGNLPEIINKHILGLGYEIEIANKLSANIFAKQFIWNGEVNKYVDYYTTEARYAVFPRHFSQPGYGIALSYFVTPGLQAKASYENTYRLPEGDEVFGDGLNQEGNPDLEPEESRNINLGFRYNKTLSHVHQVSAEAGYIYRNATGFMRPSVQGVNTTILNLRSVRNNGFEAAFDYTYKSLLKVGANTTYQNLINTTKHEAPGSNVVSTVYQDRLPNIPYFYGNANARLQLQDIKFSGDRLAIRYNAHFVEEYYLKWPSLGSRASKLNIPRQLSHDLSLTYSLENGKYDLTLECRNVTDKNLFDNYRLQLPGRAFYVKARYFLSK